MVPILGGVGFFFFLFFFFFLAREGTLRLALFLAAGLYHYQFLGNPLLFLMTIFPHLPLLLYCLQQTAAPGTFGSLQGSDPTNLYGSSRVPEVPPGDALQHPPFAVQVSSLPKDSWEGFAGMIETQSLLSLCNSASLLKNLLQ